MNLVGAQEASTADVMPLSATPGVLLQGAGTVAVVGSREFPEPERVERLVDQLPENTLVVSGGAYGVDRIAVTRAKARDMAVVEFIPGGYRKARWGRAALTRDQWFGLVADIVVAFWNGKSSGTRATIRHAMALSGKCIVVLPGERPAVWVPRI